MAYSAKEWLTVKAYYERGLSLADIVARDDVAIKSRSQIGKKAIVEGWDKSGKKRQLIEREATNRVAMAEIRDEKETFNAIERNIHDEMVRELSFLDGLVMKNLTEMAAKFAVFDAQGHRSAAEAIDKAYISLRHAPRHANQSVNVQNNVTSKETIELNTSSWTTEDFASITRLLPSENH